MAFDPTTVAAHVTTPSGRVIAIPDGTHLVFGRGPDADLVIPAGRGLSRRAGMISAVAGGALVANLSYTHALYAEGSGFRIRLPRLDEPGEPSGGWFVRQGTTLVGSRAMFDEGQPLRVVVASDPVAPAVGGSAAGFTRGDDARAGDTIAGDTVVGGAVITGTSPGTAGTTGTRTSEPLTPGSRADSEQTLLPLYLDPNTKLYLVALIWCRPWLIDPARSTPLPRTPEIARAALEVTDAHHEIECFDNDPAFRDRLSARVGEHLKVLRRKIVQRELVRPGIRLSDEVAVGALIENGIIAGRDLARLSDPAWCSRQEDLWWS